MTHFDLRRRQALIGALAAGAFAADAAHGQDKAATAATRPRTGTCSRWGLCCSAA